MIRTISKLACVVVLAALAAPAGAQTTAAAPTEVRRLGLILRMVLDVGGEELIGLRYEDGDEVKLKAGQLGTFAAGVLYRADGPWALEATVGYKFDQANASNGSVKFTRIPVDVIASFQHGRHRLGAGPTFHLSPRYTCELGVADCLGVTEVEFKPSVGGVAQYAFQYPVGASGYEAGVRFTVLKYAAKDVDQTLGANSFGFFFGGWL